jgi:hypothetical protein
MSKPEQSPSTTPYERFVSAMKQVMSVSKKELERREAAWRKKRQARKRTT